MPGVGEGEGGRLCLPPAAWPAADRACWAAATCPGDLLLDAGPAAHLRPGSLDTCADSYGRWLGWLAGAGRLDPDAAPAARVTREEVAAYVTALRRVNAPLTVLGRVADLGVISNKGTKRDTGGQRARSFRPGSLSDPSACR